MIITFCEGWPFEVPEKTNDCPGAIGRYGFLMLGMLGKSLGLTAGHAGEVDEVTALATLSMGDRSCITVKMDETARSIRDRFGKPIGDRVSGFETKP